VSTNILSILFRLYRRWPRRFKRYVLVGASVYILELVVILTAQHAGATPVTAVAISFWVGVLVSFGLQKVYSFGDRRLQRRVVLPQFIAYSLLVLFNFGFTLAVTKLVVGFMPAIMARTLALIITTTWNFYLYKFRIFRADDNPVY
jgi:putative flippase GtrA